MKKLLFGVTLLASMSSFAFGDTSSNSEIVEAIKGSLHNNPLRCSPHMRLGLSDAIDEVISFAPKGEYSMNISELYHQPLIQIVKDTEQGNRFVIEISTDTELKVVEQVSIEKTEPTDIRVNEGTILNPVYSTKLEYKRLEYFVCD